MSSKKRQLDTIRKLRSLTGNHTRNGTKRGQDLIVQLKRNGYTNVEISELSDGRWSTSTVKSYTRGVKTDNPGPRNEIINLLTEFADSHLTIEDVKETNNTAKTLRDKGLNLKEFLDFYKELQKNKIDPKDLLNKYNELKKTDIQISKLREILNYKTSLDEIGIKQEFLQQIHEVSKKYGEPTEILEAINAYGELKIIKENLKDLEKEIGEKSTERDELESRISELNKEEDVLRNKINVLTDTAADTLASSSKKIIAETEKMTEKFNDATTNLYKKTEEFQKNLVKAYGESLKEIRDKIPETANMIGEIDAKIDRSKNLSLIIDLMERPTEIKEPIAKVFGSMITLTKGMEVFTETHRDKIEKSLFIKNHLIGLQSDLLEFIQNELGKTTKGNER